LSLTNEERQIIIIIIIIIIKKIIQLNSSLFICQLQTQHSVDTGNYIKDKHNIKTREKLQASTGERKHINAEKVKKQKQRRKEIHKERNN
jgi:hypothetical protein